MSLIRTPGNYCDVMALPSVFVWIHAQGAVLTCERENGLVLWATTLDEPALFWRACASPEGAVLAVGQGQSGQLRAVLDGHDLGRLGATAGVTPCVARWAETHFEVACQVTPTRYTVRAVSAGALGPPVPHDMPATSQGFRDWHPTSGLIRSDDAFRTTLHGWTLYQPMSRDGATAGQSDPPAIRLALPDRVCTAIPGDGFEPHVAVLGDRIAICARTPQGASLALLAPPYPVGEEPPVAIPNHLDVVQRWRAHFNSLSGEERAYQVVNAVAYELRGEGCGVYKKPGGPHGVSSDVIIYKPNAETFDILRDAEGVAAPQWGRTQPSGFGDLSRWQAAVPPEEQPPDPPPPTDDLEARVARLEQFMRAVKAA